MNYTLIRSRRKTVSLIIDNKGEITVRAPLNLAATEIQKFVQSKDAWIQKKLLSSKSKQLLAAPAESGQKIMLFGRYIDVITVPGGKRAGLESGALIVGEINSAKKMLIWLKKQAESCLFERADTAAKATGFSYRQLELSNSKRYWGLCTAGKTIRLNIRLIMLPQYLIDYIIIHELCHLKHLNHSVLFWAEVQKYMPDYKKCREDLKKYSRLLELYR